MSELGEPRERAELARTAPGAQLADHAAAGANGVQGMEGSAEGSADLAESDGRRQSGGEDQAPGDPADAILSRVALSSAPSGGAWQDHHRRAARRFLADASQRLLVVYVDAAGGDVRLSASVPSHAVDEMMYFVRRRCNADAVGGADAAAGAAVVRGGAPAAADSATAAAGADAAADTVGGAAADAADAAADDDIHSGATTADAADAADAAPADAVAAGVAADGAGAERLLRSGAVLVGTVRGGHLEALLRAMGGVFVPSLLHNAGWPEGIRNDFRGHVHRFMAMLTDTRHKLEGHTVLYIPQEVLSIDAETAASDKELVGRLETAMVHWTRQIKEVLSAQDSIEDGGDAGGEGGGGGDGWGPLEEVEFWRSRRADLAGLASQLEKRGVTRVQRVLGLAKSSYVGAFARLARQIQDGSRQAESNLRFLLTLREPCEALRAGRARDAPGVLARILATVRFVWIHSEFYGSTERIGGLLRKVSTDVLRVCRREISLEGILDGGFAETGKRSLGECLACCAEWKRLYRHHAGVHRRFSASGWDLDETGIFAQVDAFAQRCQDLLEVCECQQQFGRYVDGQRAPLPCLGGQRGPAVVRSLLETQEAFARALRPLAEARATILDVNNTAWHEHCNRFRAAVKELEVMMQNLISSAFETVTMVTHGVELLDVFQHLSSREAIRRTLDRQAVEVWALLASDIADANRELSQRPAPSLRPELPRHAGQAHRLRAVRRRVDRSMQALRDASFLPPSGVGDEVTAAHRQLAQALDEAVRRHYGEWAGAVDKQALARLDVPVLVRSREHPGTIDVNFDRSLLKTFAEVFYWDRMSFEVPHYATDVYSRFDELRTLRENVLLVVRDYNRIVNSLTPEERLLFRDRIRSLDKRLHVGLGKLQWSSHEVAAFFVMECRAHSSKVQKLVDAFKAASAEIARGCRRMSETLLLRIDDDGEEVVEEEGGGQSRRGRRNRRVFSAGEFVPEQRRRRDAALGRLLREHEGLLALLRRTHEAFRSDGAEVQQCWAQHTERVERRVQEALRVNVRRSLQALARALGVGGVGGGGGGGADGAAAPSPLFRVLVGLQQQPAQASGTPQVEFEPSLALLSEEVSGVSAAVCAAVSAFKRLALSPDDDAGGEPRALIPCIAESEEIRKIRLAIDAGMAQNAAQLQAYLKTWVAYREIWEINKDAFIRRYQRQNPPVSSFDGDIGRYAEVANNVQKEETVLSVQFVLLDCAPLKLSLLRHCSEWQAKLTSLLADMAGGQLRDLHAYLRDNGERVSRPPRTLDELGDALRLLGALQAEGPRVAARLGPIHEQFAILHKHEVPVDAEVSRMLESLTAQHLSFQQCLLDSEAMLRRQKEHFRSGLLHSADEFKRRVQSLVDDFHAHGPFGSAVSCGDALGQVCNLRGQLNALKLEENDLRRGLGIFKMEQAPSKEMQALDKDLELLESVWEVAREWELCWSSWKLGHFASLDCATMEATAHSHHRQMKKLARDAKDKSWEVVTSTKARLEQFRRTMPLIGHLRNPAMRERHWTKIKQQVQGPFEQDAAAFTLEVIVELGLDRHAEAVAFISASASKELAIEQALEAVTKTWDTTVLDIEQYKDKGHYRLRGTEELFQTLEDNQVMLCTMKASPSVRPFEAEVDRWERSLSLLLEVVEALLTVQRQWMCLENIFLGEDIRKQLPLESGRFDAIDGEWREAMGTLAADTNALRGTQRPGLLERLGEMIASLEDIQKSLDMYLETKRQVFPRFYFLSNDELLEILGQARNPAAVQPHLKKCFDNIKSLTIQKVSGPSRRMEATAMASSDGEVVNFSAAVLLEGPVEAWLCDAERAMRHTLRELLRDCLLTLRKTGGKRDKWIREWPGQLLLTASQAQWTSDVHKALSTAKERADSTALKTLKKKQVSLLHRYSEAIRGSLSRPLRLRLVALATLGVRDRDVVERLARAGCADPGAFDWLSQLRTYWEKEADDCVVRQTNSQFTYGYEYLGNSGRLVITPLTDRCFLTLTTALRLHRGGCPKGPAGTGKTETVKDLGKALGVYVIVVNCSEGLDYKSMGRMYSGLAQTGAWGCFDEFHLVGEEVLSVVARQIVGVLTALAAGLRRFVFEGREVALRPSCGVFVTMNTGYADRTELPDNLKSMFRPVAMVVPDSAHIAEMVLFGEGFGNCKALARKVHTLYSLAVQQLSRQDHYDFGLRALTSLLRYAGRKRRANPGLSDEEILLMCMRDVNAPKLTPSDLPLFSAIVQDLFPGVDAPTLDDGKLREAVERELLAAGLQATASTLATCLRLHETKGSRHATALVGPTGSGKSTAWRALQAALTGLARAGEPGYSVVREFALNPKALTLGELYGEFDLNSSEWTDGVISSIMRTACTDERTDEKWIVFDGPVDTLWIESMNSVMDDNKVLTLINGERISMPEQVSLLFEVAHLAAASPATVSRCGVVYSDYHQLGWRPHVHSWLQSRPKEEAEHLRPLLERYVQLTLDFVHAACRQPVPVPECAAVASLCKLYGALATLDNGVNPADTEGLGRMVELWFLFSLVWSLCAAVDEKGRKKVDNFLREIEGTFPNKDTVYEYYVDVKNRKWSPFEDKLTKGWRYLPSTPFYKLVVPTVDTLRYHMLVSALVASQRPVLLVGSVGTGKTLLAQSVAQSLDPAAWSVLTINMSAQTSSGDVQAAVEGRVEKRTKGVLVPPGGRRLLALMDDLNVPARDAFGSRPPLELLRLWLDYGFWYDRRRQSVNFVKDMFLLGAMGPPGGGRTDISPRLQSRFNVINVTFPTDEQIAGIFGTLLNQKLQDFEEEVRPLAGVATAATVQLYGAVVARFLPTPSKTHYLFNLRDISKVFQGMLRAHKDFHDNKASVARLWVHECFRVFSDRLVDESDTEAFTGLLSEKLASTFDLTYHNLCPNRQPPIFGDFMREGVYEDITDFQALRIFMQQQLEDYNLSPGAPHMNLTLFRDAIEHVTRIVRVIRQPRGNMLLVGIGGSGRQSLVRLAAYLCRYSVFHIEVTRHYRQQEFRDDLKRLYWQAGVENRATVFILADTQIPHEAFLEDINNMLSSGEVPSLYKAEEFEQVRAALAEVALAGGFADSPEEIFRLLLERVCENLHMVLCMSPVGDSFRHRIRQYPALVNCTTIDWFWEWPRDALLEVAERCLQGAEPSGTAGGNGGTGGAGGGTGDSPELQSKVAQMFVIMHRSVAESSRRMLVELKRHNYVTPTNYLELVGGYKRLLAEKRRELGQQVSKLRSGLHKIDDTSHKVEAMRVQLEEAKRQVADFQRQCEEYLVVIVQQKREADEQQKAVVAHSERISLEEAKCKALAQNAQRDLDEALPALEEAMKALESLNKRDMTEIKSYGRPPPLVETVMQAVMILRGGEPTWAEAKRQLSDQNFIKQLANFDRDNISDRVLKKIGHYCAQPDFQPDIIGNVSGAARSLCMWVRAMEVYGRIYRIVEPKQNRLNAAVAQLQEKQASLVDAQGKLKEVTERMETLKRQYDEKLAQKEELRRSAEEMEVKLERAGALVAGLAGEKARWELTVQGLEVDMGYVVGDCLMAAAFLSYMGPFLSNYREQIVSNIWMKQMQELGVPCSPAFSFSAFLSHPTTAREWTLQGLPSDSFSTENGIIVTRGARWPLMIDPQGQATEWIKNMEASRGLKVTDLQATDLVRTLEAAVQLGSPVLLQNVQEHLDPSLAPILNRSVTRVAGRTVIKLGEKELEYNPDFRLYITTKLSNPHYAPEVSTKTTIVNFAVKEQGLEAQLLAIVVRREKPDLEEQKDSLVLAIAAGKRKLQELEDEILRLLNESQGSLLDDAQLVNALQASKVTAGEVAEQLAVSEHTEAKIDAAREGYRACAQRASVLFFVVTDMGRIDPMYQFSLASYLSLFDLSIEKSQRSPKLEQRIVNLNNHHTYSVYRSTCRGLFERHKLLFSFHMCAKILQAAGKLHHEEYAFFLRGGVVLDREGQMDNPCPEWLADSEWDNVTELDKLANFHGIMASFEQHARGWHTWCTAAQPEGTPLPGEWEDACGELQRMLLVRSLRPDRVPGCATAFVVNNLGSKFVEPPVLDMRSVVEESTPRTPLIFVLSPGVDPSGPLQQLAESAGMASRLHTLSLGQGQAPIATRLVHEGIRKGHWVYLANCHLSLSWMPQLDRLVERLQAEGATHSDFRLWLSSSPHPDFPVSVLRAGIKMTTELPKGLRANMTRLYHLVTEPQFSSRPQAYRRLLFALCFFHSLLVERRKFRQLGWNVVYGFNDSDFEVSESLLNLYLDEDEEVPWDALRYLVAGITYGGHVTDDWDRRLLTTYIGGLFCEQAVSAPYYRLSSLETYYVPRDGPLPAYREFAALLPHADHPEAFGQHPNADVASQAAETRALLGTLLGLQPQAGAGDDSGDSGADAADDAARGQRAGEAMSREDKVLALVADVALRVPPLLDVERSRRQLADEAPRSSPLGVVLLQEMERYNALLHTVRSSLSALERGIRGLVVMSADLEETFRCIHDLRVPPSWTRAYPSLKPLAAWTRDLARRVEHFSRWAETARPPVLFWLSAFTLPGGFLAAVLQASARLNGISMDCLCWEFVVSTVEDNNILVPPKDGVWVRGLYLEGAGWDRRASCLVEAEPMELVCAMPTVHFKPVENKRKSARGMYSCPCYYYPNRAGSPERPSIVLGVDLRAGSQPAEHWVKRGTALLMSLAN